ncbi:MAG: hypothetical protein JW955_19740, partial [Sedimentisphaerales bacterium]|nr:hypothetical protein [Sedimentisphaerales bacterium]
VEGRLYDGGSNMYAYDGENRLLTVTKTADALSAACDTSLTLTTGGTGAWIAQTSEAGVYRVEAERSVYEVHHGILDTTERMPRGSTRGPGSVPGRAADPRTLRTWLPHGR